MKTNLDGHEKLVKCISMIKHKQSNDIYFKIKDLCKGKRSKLLKPHSMKHPTNYTHAHTCIQTATKKTVCEEKEETM